MSAISKIGRSVNDMTSFMRDKIKSNIVDENNRDNLDLNTNQLRKVLNLIDMSFDQTFSLDFSGVEKALESVIAEVKVTAESEATTSSSRRSKSSYKK